MKKMTLFFTSLFITLNLFSQIKTNELFIIGNATDVGWTDQNPLEMKKLSDGIFTWTGELRSEKDSRFKFLPQKSWYPAITSQIVTAGYEVATSGFEYDLYVRADDKTGFDNAFQVKTTGIYTVDVNLNTMKMKLTEKKRDFLWEYVKPELGSQGDGHVFPGVCVPFGMVKLGADCGDMNENSGWNGNGNIHGFSHVHVSGTGGGPKYGNILFQPITGEVNLSNYSSQRSNEKFSLGLYAVTLNKYNINVRLTASSKVGFHEYTFPESTDAKILIDAGSCLKVNFSESQELLASGVKILSNTEIEGYSTIKGGWNMGAPYTVYFYAKIDTPSDSYSTWKGNNLLSEKVVDVVGSEKSGAYFKFKTTNGQKIKTKVAISFVSTEQAKINFSEITSWDFDEVRMAGVAKWEKIFNTVKVEGTENDKIIFYSALHHAFLQPTDRTGENPLWKSSEPYYDDYYAIWDTFRATHPLFALLTPSRQADMVRSLIDIYEHEGYMPDARSGNYNGQVQGGSNCDIVIADAFVKKIPGINYEKALKAMINNAETEPENPRKEGRGGALMYNELGYVPADIERSGTRTYEYANCDYAIATVAKGLGKIDIYEKYLQRSNNWKNLWNNKIESIGFNGFLWPKQANGDWINQNNYDVFKGENWTGVIYESFPWEMSFYVPHDINGLIKQCGGKDQFTNRLNTYFTYDKKFNQDYFIGLFQVSNEPGFLVPTLYNYVNRPNKTAEIVRKVLNTKYSTLPWGIPGNDDSGSMSAWYAFHAMGFYPNAGQDIYLISSPIFTKSTISLENGKTFEILAPESNNTNIYIQSAKLNGSPLLRCWLKHEEIVAGGKLELTMGNTPSNWSYDGELPPSSPITENIISPKIESPKIRIHSYSSQTSANEGACNLLAPSINTAKWCDNVTENPWVIFELTDEYNIDRLLIRDVKTVDKYYGNMPEYWVYASTTGVNDGDWHEIIHQTNVEKIDTKVVNLKSPTQARYIKLVGKRGINIENQPDNAIRLYGFDVHGKISQKIDKGDIISIGSRFLCSSPITSFDKSPRHLFDGYTKSSEYNWEIKKDASKSNFVVIDLEDLFNISKLKTFDSCNINGYNIYISTQMPDQNGNSAWQKISTNEINKINKEQLIKPITGRYVKIEIPSANIEGETAIISEFELYGNKSILYPEIQSPKVKIHSYSSKVNMDEGPFYLLADPKKGLKWCEIANEEGWVIFELADIYNVNRFVFRDAKTKEGNENVPEYWIYTSNTGTAENDWSEVVHQTNAQKDNIKDITIAPVKAKYIKFRAKRGIEEHPALRIYGFDIFGVLAEKTERNGVISVGSTILKSSSFSPYFNNPTHIFDGEKQSSTEYKWEVKKDGAEINYLIVDLDNEYNIEQFKVYDSNEIAGYNVYISNEKPNDNGDTNWIQVINQELNNSNKNQIITPTIGRYIKIEIPKNKLLSQVCPIYEFEIYNKKGDSTNDKYIKDQNAKTILYPNPVKQGSSLTITENGVIKIFSTTGSLIFQQEVYENTQIPIKLSHGIYFVELINNNELKSMKLIVK